ncbi:MAG TPA: YchJ family metal-binding protein [Kineosporiaceae bacterium]|nr:YchJ family metal-binding protein [Kineosporiaceae bacterium]
MAAAVRPCPCGSGETYPDCCQRCHLGETAAATAELLMRSRFSAFAVGDPAYLLRTWHSNTRPARIRLDPEQRWTRLQIVSTSNGGFLDAEGTVGFRAHYRLHGRSGQLDERSRFVREHGRWVYLAALPDD